MDLMHSARLQVHNQMIAGWFQTIPVLCRFASCCIQSLPQPVRKKTRQDNDAGFYWMNDISSSNQQCWSTEGTQHNSKCTHFPWALGTVSDHVAWQFYKYLTFFSTVRCLSSITVIHYKHILFALRVLSMLPFSVLVLLALLNLDAKKNLWG